MSYLHPRSHLATHEVTNQAEPLEDVNLFSADAILKSACDWSGAGAYAERLSEFGARVGAVETQRWAVEANKVTPVFTPYDRFGRRIDEVEFHPSYHRLMQLGLEAGVSGAAWNVPGSGHALHAALLFLMGQGDFGVTCPMSMTYAVVPALRVEPAVAAAWAPRVTCEAYDPRFAPASQKRAATMGMAMTESRAARTCAPTPRAPSLRATARMC